ncbi:substrate-binding periplasmic protein [Marinobacter fonticola]|uniref:substrate-binding periplasmic protein n=1 Tax=Marinobacter fonticola TaxID=2603215 RepID=UPI0011E74FA8|nr:transporter substrate-binding domain-containing protein [Marinobacter fonticola]
MAKDCGSFMQRALFRCKGLLVVLICLYSATAWSQRPTLRIGYVEFPPYEFQDAQGNAAGSFIELTRRVAAEAGYRTEFIYLPPSRLYLYLREGRIDVWPGLTYIPTLQDHVLVSESIPLRIELSAWHLKGTPPVRQFDDLRNRPLILVSGYTYGGLASYLNQQSGTRLSYSATHESAVDMLRLARGDYLIDYREPIEALGRTEPMADLRQSFLLETVATWLFSLKDEHARQFQADFDAAYQRLQARDELPFEPEPAMNARLPGFPDLPVRDTADVRAVGSGVKGLGE